MKLSEFFPISGIYKITCTKNDKVYIGQSKCIGQRIGSHIGNLIYGKNINLEFLNDFRIYGLDAFECDVLEEFSGTLRERLEREDYHIGKLIDEEVNLYNCVRNRLVKDG